MTFKFESVPEASPPASGPLRGVGARSSSDPGSGNHAANDEATVHRALLVGQPNVGKSVVFGALTGTYVTVSNYPGTTVEITRGRARFGGRSWEVVDTPGTHNLVPMSEDEAVTRDLIVSETYDALVQIGDAKNLTRTLLLALQLAELGIPFCLDLNMLDEARARGHLVDLAALARELPGVVVNASTATEGEGLDAVRDYLGASEGAAPTAEARLPLACAPRFPDDVEQAIADVEARLAPPPRVAKRALATMLLAGERGVAAARWAPWIDPETIRIAKERAQSLARAHGVPAFALLSRLRLTRAQEVARAVQRRELGRDNRAHAGRVSWPQAALLAMPAAVIGAATYDGALSLCADPSSGDPLAGYGFFPVATRIFSRGLFVHWTAPGLALLVLAFAASTILVHRHARSRTGGWKLALAFAAGWMAYWVAFLVQHFLLHVDSALPAHVGAAAGLATLAAEVRAGDLRDARMSQAVGRAATHPLWGLPILAVVLLLAYKVVGVFGAGSAVDFVENGIFGATVARCALDDAQPEAAMGAGDVADEGAQRLVAVSDGPARVRVVAQVKHGGVYEALGGGPIDVYAPAARVERSASGVIVEGDLRGGEARIWSGHLNRMAYGFFAWLGVPLLTAFFVGPYGLLTMGVTYAVAIVLPVVTTFFFVFSMLEDSGYLPRLAVMSNRVLRGMGLNGKAVLPMVLGLGCDTMATLTARILETRKERVLVTLLLALGIPCSSQLSVIFALMQRTSGAATLVWLGVVIGTLLGVGWVAARVLPGDKGDFLLEMPPIRQPMLRNIASKTMARIEWYLKEAVPLFLAGTALLFLLDAAHLLRFVHRAGEPIVHHMLGFPRGGGVSDRVSEALLVGFLRRDFGAAGLLDLARAGRLSPADVAVSMVTITLFIPCIANVFMIAKERGWKTAGTMSAFIFPYAVAVGAVVRLGFGIFGGHS
ncbi:MAG TPA: ferrous iron transporter B [Polyangiaceae bacterium]|nr:ferrous iron transporter B [Polyangiaceae bacterium]